MLKHWPYINWFKYYQLPNYNWKPGKWGTSEKAAIPRRGLSSSEPNSTGRTFQGKIKYFNITGITNKFYIRLNDSILLKRSILTDFLQNDNSCFVYA